MNLEIERKFLCRLTKAQAEEFALASRQVKSIYLHSSKEESLRVVKDTWRDGKVTCFWTEKKSLENSISRIENEEELPVGIFNALDESNKYPVIEKERFLISVKGHVWEVDFFKNYDFVIAELEFTSEEEATSFNDLPYWIEREVTDDPFYLNCNLAKLPLEA